MRKKAFVVVFFFLTAFRPDGAFAGTIPLVPDSVATDKEFKKEFDALPKEDRELIAQYILRMVGATVLPGLTRGEIPVGGISFDEAIRRQKAFNANDEEPQGDRKSPLDEVRERMREAILFSDVALREETVGKYVQSQSVRISVKVKNATDKKIIGVRIAVYIRDVFGSTIDSPYILQTDEDIDPSQTITLHRNVMADRYLASDRSKATTEAVPVMIIFEDGTSLDAKNFTIF